MSRSDEEWNNARNTAIRIRSLLYEAQDLLDSLDPTFSHELSEHAHSFNKNTDKAVNDCNFMIGRLTRPFDYKEKDLKRRQCACGLHHSQGECSRYYQVKNIDNLQG